LVELPSAWELCDSSHFLFSFSPSYRTGLAAPSRVEEIWTGDFDYMYAEGGDITYILTMHPEIIGRGHRMAMLERTLDHILAHDDVWFAQMHELSTLFRQHQTQP
jgi:peptidoglycan/xylan/chitin deacetylase (PgdA/CDA1 family)